MTEKIDWCIKKKRGIELIEPNNNLAEAYLLKAENALLSMKANEGNTDWEVSSSYYAMYFSVYAILMKIGVKSEIHSCTIEFTKKYLAKYFSEEETSLLEDACNARIDMQYYTDRLINEEEHRKIIENTPDFMIKCKDALHKIENPEIEEIRNDLKKRIESG